jgi:hypothetical protein
VSWQLIAKGCSKTPLYSAYEVTVKNMELELKYYEETGVDVNIFDKRRLV